MKLLAKYQNGNTTTSIFDNGTKVHYTEDDDFRFDFAESCDIQISQCCDNGCEWCYYGCSPTGRHGKLYGWKFFETMHPYTEIAINLQSPVPPEIIPFLTEMRNRNVIVNITVNQNHFMDDSMLALICHLERHGLIKGIGVSLTNPRQDYFLDTIKEFSNAVIHVIAGITPLEDIEYLMGHGLKLLILGYKQIGRGETYFSKFGNCLSIITNISGLANRLESFVNGFKVVSFDNLALEQLGVKNKVSKQEWEMFYGGDDGTVTFFIDLVKGVFAKSSLSQIVYPIRDKSIDEMFEIIRNEGEHE